MNAFRRFLLIAVMVPAGMATTVWVGYAQQGTPCNPVALSIRGDTLRLSEQGGGDRVIVMFYNTYSCRECMEELNRALEFLIGADSSIHRLGLLRTESDILLRRANLTEAKGIFPNVKQYLFDIQEPGVKDPTPPVGLKGGLYGCFGVSRTPALLIVEPDGRYTFLSNRDLYPPGDPSEPIERLMRVIGPRLKQREEIRTSDNR